MEYQPDRTERQVARLTNHVRDCEDFVNLIELFAVKHQVTEDLFYGLFTRTRFGDAIAAQLDVYGNHLVTGREGRDDPTYQSLLETRYDSFQSSGEPERMIARLLELTGAYLVEYDDTYKHRCNNMIVFFTVLAELEAIDQEIVINAMKREKQGGQGLRIAFALEPEFRLGIGDTPTLDSDNGFNSGLLVEVIVEY